MTSQPTTSHHKRIPSHHIAPHHFTSVDITSHQLQSHHMWAHHMTSHYITWHVATNHITSPHTYSQPTTLLHLTSQPTTWHHVPQHRTLHHLHRHNTETQPPTKTPPPDGTAEGGWSPCAHSISKFLLWFGLQFFFPGKLPHRLVRELHCRKT